MKKIYLAIGYPVGFNNAEEKIFGVFDDYEKAKERAIKETKDHWYNGWAVRETNYYKGDKNE